MSKGMSATVYPELLWAGTEHSLQLAIQAHEQRAGIFSSSDHTDPDEEDLPYMLSIQDGIGVVTIRGSLVNNNDPWNKYFGVSGYPDIREALLHAAQDPGVKGILLDIHSGGGAVAGVSDTADLISTIDAGIKPVWAVTDGTMASAAYWLGCSAGSVFSSDTSIVGSIGVICTHMEYSKALKEAGIGVTVMRAGEYKALANSVEPLSEIAQRQVQDQLNAAYQIFIGHVAESRGTTVNLADQKMGQGREFFGAQALEAGLVDGIMSFDKAFSSMQTKLLDSAKVTQNNYGNHHQGPGMTRKALTQTQIAAAAAGAIIATATEGAGTTQPATETTAQPAGTAQPAAETTAQPAAETTAQPAGTAQPSTELVTLLQGQLSTANERIVLLSVEQSQMKTKLEALQPQVEALKAIACRSLSTMKVALGHSAIDASTLTVDSLLTEHAATSEAFHKAFKAGGVAAPNQTDKPESEQTTSTALHQARIAAVRPVR